MSDTNKDNDFDDLDLDLELDDDPASDGFDDTLPDIEDADADEFFDEELDDDWDAFDDGDDSVEAASTPAAAKEKSFVAKHFNLIVIGAAVVIGGGIVLPKLFSKPQSPTPAPVAQNDVGTAVDQETLKALKDLRDFDDKQVVTLPYDAEIAALENNQAADQQDTLGELTITPDDLAPEDDLFANLDDAPVVANTVSEPDPALIDDTILMPLPVTTEDERALEPIAAPNDLMPFEGTAQDDNVSLLPPLNEGEQEFAEEIVDLDASLDNAEAPLLPPLDVTETAMEPVDAVEAADEFTLTLNADDTVNDEINLTPEPVIADLNIQDNTSTAITAQPVEDDQSADISALEQEIAALQSKIADLASDNTSLERELSSSQNKADRLENTVQSLEDKLATRPQAPRQQSKPVQSEPTRSQQNRSAAPVPQAKAAPTIWNLRSAQHGKAVLANQNNQLVRIEVGDNVKGLGRIQSIAFTNSGWVVQGSIGSVTQ